ncbi:MAG: HEAT repeat domain-containing protein, partial [Planctomycetota bacterium]
MAARRRRWKWLVPLGLLGVGLACYLYIVISGAIVNGLVSDLASDDPAVRAAATEKLAQMPSRRVVERLIFVIGGEEGDITQMDAALCALVESACRERPTTARRGWWRWLPRFASERIDLTRPDRRRVSRATTRRIIPALGRDATPPLAALLEHRDPHVREFAIAALMRIDARGRLALFLPLLEDDDQRVRQA